VRFSVTVASESLPVEVVEAADQRGRYRVRLGDQWLDVDARLSPGGPVSLLIDGRSYLADVREENDEVVVTIGGASHRLRVAEAGRSAGRPGGRVATGSGERLVAPMPGRVVAIHVRPGDRVEPGTPLVVLEAMKMENEFRATTAGVVTDVAVTPGQPVNAGDLLVVVGPGR
jgi:biotin carboxyl carrier protein